MIMFLIALASHGAMPATTWIQVPGLISIFMPPTLAPCTPYVHRLFGPRVGLNTPGFNPGEFHA